MCRGVCGYSVAAWCGFSGSLMQLNIVNLCALVDNMSRLAADWCSANNRHGCQISIFSSTSRTKFQPKYNIWLCISSFEWTSHLFAPLLPPVHCALCAHHQNTIKKGKARVRKIPNSRSTARAGRCTSSKIWSDWLICYLWTEPD